MVQYWSDLITTMVTPRLQAALLGMCLFSTVGMYNVLLSIGGSGQATATLSDGSNIALYAVFLVLCIAAPGRLSYFGVEHHWFLDL